MRNTFFTLLLILSLYQLKAQPYEIEKISLEHGLSNGYIMGITQDQKGFMWFSTESGLNRFDGNEFRVYKKNDSQKPSTINSNELNTVYADKFDDIIWIATQREGLTAFDCKTETFSYYISTPENREGIVTNDITDVINSQDGNIWISTYHWGFDYFDKKTGKFTHYNQTTLPGLVSNNIWSVAEDKNGMLYLGHVTEGLTLFSPEKGTLQNYKHIPNDPHSLPGNTVYALCIDSNNNIWVGTDNGLALLNTKNNKFTVFKNNPHNAKSLLSNVILSISQTKDGKLWIGTENGGISILDAQKYLFSLSQDIDFINILPGDDDYSLSNQSIRKIYQDSFNNIWIGTYGGGINFISNREPLFKRISYSPIPSMKNRLSHKIAWGLCIDDENKLWVGTDGGGIDVFKDGVKMQTYNKSNSNLSDNAILSAYKDSQGRLWFGTFSGGVNIYSSNNFKQLPMGDLIDARCLTEDHYGNMWIGTSRGIYISNPKGEITATYTSSNSDLEEDLVRAIFIDEKEHVWVGCFGDGLSVYDPDMKKLRSFYASNDLPSNLINCIYGDSKGRIWVGTSEGLVRIETQNDLFNITVFDEKDGIKDSHIKSITEDEKGNIWVSTTSDISAYDASLNKFYNFNHNDGIPLGGFNSGSVAKNKQGILGFGSQNGVCYFDPSSLPIESKLPQVAITDFTIYDAKLGTKLETLHSPIESIIKLNYDQNIFEVSFNILDYSLNNLVEYNYMLKGLGDAWYNTQGKNTATFRGIPHGTYQLLIKSRIRNQEWSDNITALHIHISPPLWLTWWAKLIYIGVAFLIITFIALFYKHKLELENTLILEKRNYQQSQELNNERLRFFTNITHELRTPLTLILGPLEDLNSDKTLSEKHARKISVIYKSATRLLNLINQILEFRRTETQNKQLSVKKESLLKVVQEIGLKYKELNSKAEVTFDITIEEGEYFLYYDTDVIATILENLISNALKYTEKGNVILTLRRVQEKTSQYAEIEVKDTGRGIHPDYLPKIFDRYYQEKNSFQKSGTGIGLALVQNLVKLHQGEIFVESSLDKGTIFRFRIKADNEYPNALHLSSDETANTNEHTSETEEQTSTGESREIVLVIEDNEEINKYIVESLSEDYKVYAALNGQEGLTKAQEIIPNMIISDIVMPELDGLSLTKILKDDIRTSHIPVILLTAKDTIQDKTEGYSIGADSYITKPFSSGLLKSRIKNLLESRREAAQNRQNNMDIKAELMTKALNHLDKEFIERIEQIIEENIDSESFDINLIAEKMCMSHSTLYRKIKALTDMSINEFIRKARMRKAEELLLTGKYTISEISYMVGMNSIVYFRRCFKEEFGFTPTDYIKQIKNKK